ncbi:hypothetical protein SAMN05661080_02909 [Modestobacter sp. DSM 44400]|uniref:hypothetical protein n=1 Tax=Modestobacter sp. DSM 44400 TaxID=1550230 RepID=UPI000899AA2C|nr:hypothetical protein [Modestobacter sp. DSM 44400]SDY27394.1 hypothetical protein SAMN05661080_02909 [Modestobacter sp. DSM 44400]
MTGRTYLLTDDQGEPVGVADLDEINARGDRLAFALAAASNRPQEIERLLDEEIAAVGVREVRYVVAAALGTVVQDILEPLVMVAESAGVPIRERLAEPVGALCQVSGHRHALFERVGITVRCTGRRREEGS